MNNCVAICLLVGFVSLWSPISGMAADQSTTAKSRVSTVAVDPQTGRLVRLRSGARLKTAVTKTTKEAVARARKEAEKTPELAPEQIRSMIEETAARHGVDADLVHSVIRVESNYAQKAISPKGAQGLMQLIPSTAERFGVNNPFDPEQNLEGGVRYLKFLTERFDGDVRLALAAYNAGEGAVDRHNGIPPYAETQQYVTKVARAMQARGRQLEAGEQIAKQTSANPERLAASQSSPAKPAYAPIRAYMDDAGRLHVETIP